MNSSYGALSARRFLLVIGIAIAVLSEVVGAPEAFAAVSFIQQNANTFRSVSTATLTFNASTGAGDLIIVGIYFGPSASISSVTDSQGNTYTQIGSAQSSPSGKESSALFYARNIAGGTDRVTVTLNG